MRVFKNAEFISCEDQNRIFSYLVEDKGRIVFTGSELPDQYTQCPSVDLDYRCVVPAFGDTHIHFTSFAYFNSGLDCRAVCDFDQLSESVRAHIARAKAEKVVLAFGCSAHTVKEKRLPDRADLDKITAHPLMIVKYDGHAGVANSALIDKMPASILSEEGFDRPSGWFSLNAFYRAVNHITRSISLPTVFKNLIAGSDYLARRGIGLVHAAEGVGFPLDLDVDIMRLANRGLPQKFQVYFQSMKVQKALARKLPCIGGCFATALDGCFGSEDAALKEPYTHNPASSGTLFYSQKEVNDFAREANRAGLQIALHAIGDAAVDQAIEAYESALKDFPRENHRHVIIHADLMSEEAIRRAAKLNLCIALQPSFLQWPQEPVEYLQRILGSRIDNLIPLRSMHDAGLTMAGGSDAPCTLPDPIGALHAACNHPNPDQSIDALSALRMHTSACAKLSFDEDERGTLTCGKLADFVVLDQNPLRVPSQALNTIAIRDVYFRGELYTGQEKRSFSTFLLDSIRNKYPST
jgi:predicted amidohydrolase YtcJ